MRRADLYTVVRSLAKALLDLEDAEAQVVRQRTRERADARDWEPSDLEAVVVARCLVLGALNTLKDVRSGMWEGEEVRAATLATWRREIEGRTAEPTLRAYWGDAELSGGTATAPMAGQASQVTAG